MHVKNVWKLLYVFFPVSYPCNFAIYNYFLVECTSALGEDEEQSIESYILMLNKLPVVFATPHQPVVKDENISELENPVQSVLNYLQRSLSIMIKSVMSMLYGTKETLQIMHLVSLKLSCLSENLKKRLRDKLYLTIKRCCRFQKRECIEANGFKDWLWHRKEMLASGSDHIKSGIYQKT